MSCVVYSTAYEMGSIVYKIDKTGILSGRSNSSTANGWTV